VVVVIDRTRGRDGASRREVEAGLVEIFFEQEN
jgi:hypothetical protein